MRCDVSVSSRPADSLRKVLDVMKQRCHNSHALSEQGSINRARAVESTESDSVVACLRAKSDSLTRSGSDNRFVQSGIVEQGVFVVVVGNDGECHSDSKKSDREGEQRDVDEERCGDERLDGTAARVDVDDVCKRSQIVSAPFLG